MSTEKQIESIKQHICRKQLSHILNNSKEESIYSFEMSFVNMDKKNTIDDIKKKISDSFTKTGWNIDFDTNSEIINNIYYMNLTSYGDIFRMICKFKL